VGLALLDGQTWPIETDATVINRTLGAEARCGPRMPVAIRLNAPTACLAEFSPRGIGSIKILDSVKAYRPGHLVTKEEVHALMGVVAIDPMPTREY
jgi:hypothetical protein